jgi:phosphoadenosine phosphosulfate reductase
LGGAPEPQPAAAAISESIMTTELLLLRKNLEEATGPACFTCSFQAEDVVVLHLLLQVQPGIPVLFLDTGYHFPDLLVYRDQLTQSWNVNLISVASHVSRAGQEAEFGPVYRNDPALCCRMRKVEPLFRVLESYSVWFTGLRREQSPTCANLLPVETTTLPSGHTLRKVSPLALWQWNEVWSYLRVNEIPPAPLYEKGYRSIGCEPCTTPPTHPENGRSGRWGGAKLECGIHIRAERG